MTDLIVETWTAVEAGLPADKREVAVKGNDTQGDWTITGGVWWQSYKRQPHGNGRWMQEMGAGDPIRLPESDDVTHWRYV